MKSPLLAFLLVFVVTISFGQTNSDIDDKTKLLGTWQIYELIEDGEVTMSRDPEKQQKLIGDDWRKDSTAMLEMEKGAPKTIKQEKSEMFFKMSFTFDEEGKSTFSANDEKSPVVFSSYTINEEKHEITVIENEEIAKFGYQLLDDLLILKFENNRLVFKRM